MVLLYNRLVRLRNRAENAWSQVDVQLRRRYDLIPNLVETVKGYASHERATFEEVTRCPHRGPGGGAPSVEQQAEAEEHAHGLGLGRLFAVAEAYPELRATENFQQLQAAARGDGVERDRRLTPGLQRHGADVRHRDRVRAGRNGRPAVGFPAPAVLRAAAAVAAREALRVSF